MKLNDVTMRVYMIYQHRLAEYGDPKAAELQVATLNAGAVIRAARESGIVESLPQELAEGDPMDLSPRFYNLVLDTAVAVTKHINEARADLPGE